MGWFMDIFSGNEEEKKKLSNLGRTLSKEMDSWIWNYPNDDGTMVPHEEQCKEVVEDVKLPEILKSFDSTTVTPSRDLERFAEFVTDCKALHEELDDMRGNLNRRFSRAVYNNLEATPAKLLLKEWVKKTDRKEKQIPSVLPTKRNVISKEYKELVEDLEGWIDPRYPGEGAEGLDNYGDAPLDGTPSQNESKEGVAANKEEQSKGTNKDAICAEIETTTEGWKTLDAVKKKNIDKSIQSTIEAVEGGLSIDAFLYLDEKTTAELRNELLALAEEYGNARLWETT